MIERRKVPRAKLRSAVECRSDGYVGPAEMYDISTDGCMLHSPPDFVCEGAGIIIRLSDGKLVEGTVVWHRDLTAGVQFRAPLQSGVDAVTAYDRQMAELDPMLRQRPIRHRRPGEYSS